MGTSLTAVAGRSTCPGMAQPQGPFYVELGAKISHLRRDRALKQEELAAKVGLTRTSITNIEKGRQPVQAHILVMLATALQVSIVELLPQDNLSNSVQLSALKQKERDWVARIINNPANSDLSHGS